VCKQRVGCRILFFVGQFTGLCYRLFKQFGHG
jgi:hypothetical protein